MVQALERFQTGTIKASEVFEPEALCKFLALCDLLGAQETTAWWNLRFFTDSLSGKLVVIPEHLKSGSAIAGILASRTGNPIRFPSAASGSTGRLLGDPVIYRGYIAWLDSLSRDGWLEGLLERHGTEIAHLDQVVRSEYPGVRSDNAVFTHSRAVVKMALRPRAAALAYIRNEGLRKDQLAVVNVHDLPIEVHGYVMPPDTFLFPEREILWTRERGLPLQYSYFTIQGPMDAQRPISVLVSVLGSEERILVLAHPWSTFVAQQ
jgi:hypothetical protein